MNKAPQFPSWLIFAAIFVFVAFPRLFIFLLFGYIAYVLVTTYLGKNKMNLADILNDEFGDFFSGKPKKKRGKVITVNEKIKKQNISFSPPSMPNIPVGKILGIFLPLAIVFLIILDGIYTVPAGHAGVIFSRTGGVKQESVGEGLHFKIPFWENAYFMSTRLQTYTMSSNLSEGDMINNLRAQQVQSIVGKSYNEVARVARDTSGSGGNPVDALTSDGQRVTVDLTVQFSINMKDAPTIYQTKGLSYVDKVVRPAARSVTREVITGFSSEELYALDTREKMEAAMEEKLSQNFEKNNVQLQDVLVRSIRFSEVFLGSIEEKQVEAQNAQKAQNRLERTKIEAQQKIEAAKGEAESIRLRGEALRENPEVIQLQFVEKMAPQINWGILPDGALPLIDIKDMQR